MALNFSQFFNFRLQPYINLAISINICFQRVYTFLKFCISSIITPTKRSSNHIPNIHFPRNYFTNLNSDNNRTATWKLFIKHRQNEMQFSTKYLPNIYSAHLSHTSICFSLSQLTPICKIHVIQIWTAHLPEGTGGGAEKKNALQQQVAKFEIQIE